MSTLTHVQPARTTAAGSDDLHVAKSAWRPLLRLAVVLGSVFSGGVAAQILLGDPGVQATVVNAATGSAGAVVATLAAYLLVRRMHRTLALADVLLGATVTLLAAVSAIAAVMPALDTAADREFVQLVAVMGAGVVASLGLVAAAAARNRGLSAVKATDGVYAATLLAGAVAVAGAALLADWAGIGIAPGDGRPAVLAAVHLTAAAGAGAAALSFFRASAQGREPVLAWLAVAAAIVAAAHLTDTLTLWSSSDTLSGGGNLVHVAGWLALLVGGIRDVEWAHRRDARDAVLDERRRLARELHDGLAQELAYITTESRRLSGPGAEHLAEAAERALEESRAAILALTRPADEPLERTIAVAAQSIGVRAGIDVTVAVRPGLDAPAEVRQALLRILREAMGNAARHGRATTVHVSLDGPSPLVMAIADDGTGFDLTAAPRPDSLGLRSMHERALNLGGRLSVESVTGQGTTVAMVLP